jgi:hypothetical protein
MGGDTFGYVVAGVGLVSLVHIMDWYRPKLLTTRTTGLPGIYATRLVFLRVLVGAVWYPLVIVGFPIAILYAIVVQVAIWLWRATSPNR